VIDAGIQGLEPVVWSPVETGELEQLVVRRSHEHIGSLDDLGLSLEARGGLGRLTRWQVAILHAAQRVV
jgi:hypothetical protein